MKGNANRNADVMFTEVENDNSHGNTAISSDKTDAVSGENRVNFPDREVLISKTKFVGNRMGSLTAGRTIEG